MMKSTLLFTNLHMYNQIANSHLEYLIINHVAKINHAKLVTILILPSQVAQITIHTKAAEYWVAVREDHCSCLARTSPGFSVEKFVFCSRA
jgi:flavorubredoxin